MEASATPGKDFLSFVNASPSPYHAVHGTIGRLEKAGFKKILERKDWSQTCKPGGKYYVTRNTSSIIAFAVGNKWKPGSPIAAVGAHTDSPCLRVKPISKRQSEGYLQVGVETYGGGLWHTWFDRDLTLAGRVMVRTKDGEFRQQLVNLGNEPGDAPMLRIPNLAIHLERNANPFEFDKEKQLFPIAGMAEAQLNQPKDTASVSQTLTQDSDGDGKIFTPDSEGTFPPLKVITERHHSGLLEAVAAKCKVAVDEIEDFELVLYDFDKARIGGLNRELLFAPRLDNLEMSYCSTVSLIESVSSKNALAAEKGIRLIALFDHEEVGSSSAQGADSNMLPTVMRRLSVLPGKDGGAPSPTAFEQTLATSFILSADMAHAVHPNYAGKHEAAHHPILNKGPVVKVNANQRYMTNAPGIVLLQEAARRARVPLQLFVSSNAVACGSTIGPMLASKLGIRTLDLGNPQLSMHSIRETGGVYDVDYAVRLFKQFFEDYSELGEKILVD